MAGWRFWWWRCQRIGGAFEGCRLVEHVPAITLVARLGTVLRCGDSWARWRYWPARRCACRSAIGHVFRGQKRGHW